MADNGPFPVFAPDGTQLGNMTSFQGQVPLPASASDWGTIPDYLSSIPSTFAPSSTTPGNVIVSQGGASSTGGTISAASPNSAAVPSNAQAQASAGGVTSGSMGDYFLRFVIVVLGFIFVAVGLNMFKPGIVPNPVRAVR